MVRSLSPSMLPVGMTPLLCSQDGKAGLWVQCSVYIVLPAIAFFACTLARGSQLCDPEQEGVIPNGWAPLCSDTIQLQV